MLNIACRPPSVNQADIYRNGLTNMGVSPLSPNLVNFGIALGDQMAVVPARILNPPKIAYAGNKIMDVRDSAWNLRDLRFFKGARIQNCLALTLSESGRDFQGSSDPAFLEVSLYQTMSHAMKNITNKIPCLLDTCWTPF